MKRISFNLQAGLVLAIVMLGAIWAVTTYVTTRVYRELTFDYQGQYLSQLIRLEVSDSLESMERQSTQLGLQIQAGDGFMEVLHSGDFDEVSRELWRQFGLGLVTANVVHAVRLYAFDADFTLLGSATRLLEEKDPYQLTCPDLLQRAQARQGPQRLQPLAEICLADGYPYLALLMPVGEMRADGYLQVVTDPLPRFSAMEQALDIPVRFTRPDGTVIHESADWPGSDTGNLIRSEFTLSTQTGEPALRITAARNADALMSRLAVTDARVLLLVVLVILVTIVTALVLVKFAVFDPLRNISNQLRTGGFSGKAGVERAKSYDADSTSVSFHALGELYEVLHDMAIRDPLTGLYNRSLFEDRLKQIIAESRRIPTRAAILLLDMVRFKYVNDVLGHHSGDLLLKQVVERLSGVLRESDTLARLGGDEFTIILPDADGEQAKLVAEKILIALEPEFEIEGHTLSASVSIGISLFPDHGETVEAILRHADFAMYTAKKSAPGYVLYNPQTTDRLRATELSLSGALRRAIDENELFLVYQPVLDMKDGHVTYVEALVRWQHIDGQIWPSDGFIRIAEQSGLIKQLSEWVVAAACRQFAAWVQYHPELRLGINLSMHNLHDVQLPDYIRSVLYDYHLDPASILIEITETGVMLDPDQVLDTLNHLADMGLKLAIDDFGTGQSSLVYLKRLPVHALKIDRSFVLNMNHDEEDAAIVHATIDLAHSLGLRVTAEGVESEAVYRRLREMGCDEYQGYYVSKPLQPEMLMQWVAGNTGSRTQVS
jgi:diguanylate cyclase (GGDEF)-like protein